MSVLSRKCKNSIMKHMNIQFKSLGKSRNSLNNWENWVSYKNHDFQVKNSLFVYQDYILRRFLRFCVRILIGILESWKLKAFAFRPTFMLHDTKFCRMNEKFVSQKTPRVKMTLCYWKNRAIQTQIRRD